MKAWRCTCGHWEELPAAVDALVEGYRRLLAHREKEHNEKGNER